jgi:3-deoxy-D-manno-octulosonic-acid transferase
VARPGDLTAAAPPLSGDPDTLAALEAALAGRPRWLAASPPRGEERSIGETHRALRTRHPGLLTLLAPRHPGRAVAIRRELEGLGLTVAQRSRSETIEPATDVYLADTIGELGLWYRLAEVVFVGGSLVPHGGQNLLEPAKLDCAILAGPHTVNFARLVAEMSDCAALRHVGGPADLTAAVDDLLGDPQQCRSLANAAARYATSEAGVLDRTMELLEPLLRMADTVG